MLRDQVIVPISVAFKKNHEIDYNNTKIHINFLLDQNVKIFYLAQSASELERMSKTERIKIAKFVSKIIHKKAKLILQPLVHTHIDDQIDEAKKLIKLGCDALVIKPLREKGKQDFYSRRFKLSEYNPARHDNYYISYMNEICSKLPIPIIFHHDDINNSCGLNLDTLAKILANKKIVALKEHNKSLKSRNKIYKKFGKKLICYDGFSKADFISSYIHGARAKHSNFSWFEPKWDLLFMKCLKNKRYKLAKKMCDIENDIKNSIIQTGYAGYKELIKLSKILKISGHTRMPGCNITGKLTKNLMRSHLKFNNKKKKFMENYKKFL
jgi:dihydrodipicolinate synthase/N-acetylneuraminate lyase